MCLANAIVTYCQALSPNPLGPAATQFKVPISFKGTGADTKILWAIGLRIVFQDEDVWRDPGATDQLLLHRQ